MVDAVHYDCCLLKVKQSFHFRALLLRFKLAFGKSRVKRVSKVAFFVVEKAQTVHSEEETAFAHRSVSEHPVLIVLDLGDI